MKQFFTLLISSLVALSSFARPPQTILSVSSFSNTNLRITIDGYNYNFNNDDDFVLNNIQPGQHQIKIYKTKNRGYGYGSNNSTIIYQSNIFLRNNYHTDITINRFGKVFIDEAPIGFGGYNNYPNNYPNNYLNQTYNNPMGLVGFEALKSSVNKERFDDSRLNIIKQAAINNYFSTDQIKQLISLFNFESTKLELAKFLYGRATDRENYFIINDVFSFSSSRDALSKYIIEYRP